MFFRALVSRVIIGILSLFSFVLGTFSFQLKMTNLTLGISLAIFSNIFTGLSYTASKAAHNRVSASQSIAITQHSDEEDSESLEEVPPTPTQLLPLQQPSIFLVLRQSTWWLGILLLATGNLLYNDYKTPRSWRYSSRTVNTYTLRPPAS